MRQEGIAGRLPQDDGIQSLLVDSTSLWSRAPKMREGPADRNGNVGETPWVQDELRDGTTSVPGRSQDGIVSP